MKVRILACLTLLLILRASALAQWVFPESPSTYPTINVRNGCGGTPGAKGNGTTDDSAVFAACIQKALADCAAGQLDVIQVPSGTYLIKATPLPVMARCGIKIKGDGSYASVIKVDPAYSGDLFSWDEAWGGVLNGRGASVEGILVIGTLPSTNIQNAFSFYDRADFVYFQDVTVSTLNGACLQTGQNQTTTQAYMRESSFYTLTCFHTGTTTTPAVILSSTTTSGSDATNELHFFGLELFSSASVGILMSNPNAFSATRLIEFYGVRVESSAADNIDIGASGDLGNTNQIYFYGMQSITPGATNSGFYALNIGLGSLQDYGIELIGGEIGPCAAATACNGLKVDNARLTSTRLNAIGVTGTDVTYTARTGSYVILDVGGFEANLTYSVPGTVTIPSLTTFTP